MIVKSLQKLLCYFWKHLHWTILIQFLLQCKSLELGPMVIYTGTKHCTFEAVGSWAP